MGGAEITEAIAKEAMRLAQYKLPIKTKFLTLADQPEEPVQAMATVSTPVAAPEPALAVES
jgi:large subunit ribosomal protein L16